MREDQVGGSYSLRPSRVGRDPVVLRSIERRRKGIFGTRVEEPRWGPWRAGPEDPTLHDSSRVCPPSRPTLGV